MRDRKRAKDPLLEMISAETSALRRPVMSPEEVRVLTNVSRETMERLSLYETLLRRWQTTINLVGPKTLHDLWRRHMLDSLQLLPYIDAAAKKMRKRPVIVDLGSGAGFPGMVLAIAGAGELHLVECNRRKCTFLQEVARATGTVLAIHAQRIEALDPWPTDILTARAVAPLGKLLKHAEPFLKERTKHTICFFYKGRKVQEELTTAQKEWRMSVERLPSLTSSAGTILRLEGVARYRQSPRKVEAP